MSYEKELEARHEKVLKLVDELNDLVAELAMKEGKESALYLIESAMEVCKDNKFFM